MDLVKKTAASMIPCERLPIPTRPASIHALGSPVTGRPQRRSGILQDIVDLIVVVW